MSHNQHLVARIFERLEETKLLEALLRKKKLCFIGEAETIAYLEGFFAPRGKPGFCYFPWTFGCDNLNVPAIERCTAVIVASVGDEKAICADVRNYLEREQIDLPVLQLFTDIWVNLMLDREILQTSDYEIEQPKLSYAVVSTPRSGSTFLCNVLKSTQIAGFPEEHLREPSLILAQNCHFDYVKYFQGIMTYKITGNGVFGTKLISHFLKGHRETTELDYNPVENISKFIYLIRKDKVGQAVSRFVAEKTNIWDVKAYDKKRQKKYQARLKQVDIKRTDWARVKELHEDLLEQETYLKEFFALNEIEPLKIYYEELEQDILGGVEKILKAIGIKYERENLTIKMPDVKLRTELSREIIKKYQETY